jgi:hypothetical protein
LALPSCPQSNVQHSSHFDKNAIAFSHMFIATSQTGAERDYEDVRVVVEALRFLYVRIQEVQGALDMDQLVLKVLEVRK